MTKRDWLKHPNTEWWMLIDWSQISDEGKRKIMYGTQGVRA